MPRRRDLTNLPKDVYRELYHFCLQYGAFQARLRGCYGPSGVRYSDLPRGGGPGDQTAAQAERALGLQTNIRLIEETAREVCPAEYKLLLYSVTRDVSFTNLKTRHDLQMGKEAFRMTRRQFFYRLAEKLGRV